MFDDEIMIGQQLIELFLLTPTSVLIFSDLRYRSVSLFWLGLFGLSGLFSAILSFPLNGIIYNSLLNIILLCWMIGGVWLYLKLRYRGQRNDFNQHCGSGDLIFMLLLTPQVTLSEYFILLFGGCLLGLAYWCIMRITARRVVTIPLVSAIGSIFTIQLFYRFYTNFS